MKLLEEFNNLSQEDSLEDYNERFVELRLWLLSINPYLRDSYFIWCYTNGLNGEIRSLVKLGRPKELEEAMKLTALHNKPATQERAQQPNLKPNSSISTLTETEIPNSTSTTFDVLGEGQTIRESADRGLKMLADGVLGDSEPELAEKDATELAQVKEITNLPNDMNQESDENLVKQGTWFKTSKVTSELSFTVESALEPELEFALEKVAKEDEICVENENPFGIGEILKKFTEFGVASIGLLKVPTEYQVSFAKFDPGRVIPEEIGKVFERLAVAYNMFDKMHGLGKLAWGTNCNCYLVIFDPGGWHNVNSFGMEKMMLGVGMKLSECVGIPSRFESFNPCSVGISYGVSVLEASSGVGLVFDPGIVNDVVYSFKFIKDEVVLTLFDIGESATTHVNTQWVLACMGTSFPYDRRRFNIVQVTDFPKQLLSGNFVF